ncbi:MAG: tyrosine-type recombinase/integrase [Nanoarchaeales archaeon]|nr:tyrosine-type recombinase/integrase [Nanoarchaeales archaeon]
MKQHKEYKDIVEEFYNRRIENLIEKNPLLNENNKKEMYLYVDFLESRTKQTYTDDYGRRFDYKIIGSKQSILRYVNNIIKFGEYIEKNLIDATKEDIDNYKINFKKTTTQQRIEIREKKLKSFGIEIPRNPLTHKQRNKSPKISQKTIDLYLITIKRFYIWSYNKDNFVMGKIPKLVSNLQINNSSDNIKSIAPNEVLTPQDIKNLIGGTVGARNKCIISLLYESGARIGELVACNIGSIEDLGKYGFIKLDGKTGERRVILVNSLPYIRKLINEHKYKDELNAPLFLSMCYQNRFGRLSNVACQDIINRSAKLIKLNKKTNLHFFRHSKIDSLYRTQGLNERDLRIFSGWSENSNMYKRYVHYGEEAVSDKILKFHGIDINKTKKVDTAMDKRICVICEERFPERPELFEHSPEVRYCGCGAVLDENEAKKLHKLKEDELKFMKILMSPGIFNNLDVSKGLDNGLINSIMENPLLREKFEEIHKENEFGKLA